MTQKLPNWHNFYEIQLKKKTHLAYSQTKFFVALGNNKKIHGVLKMCFVSCKLYKYLLRFIF